MEEGSTSVFRDTSRFFYPSNSSVLPDVHRPAADQLILTDEMRVTRRSRLQMINSDPAPLAASHGGLKGRHVCVKLGLMSLMTSHPGAKRLSSIQTGLMVSLSYGLEWRAVKRLCAGVTAADTGVGTHVAPALVRM